MALRAAADGVVVHHLAASVLSASSWARVSALLVQAGLLQRALGARHTFRPARWWCSNKTTDARAHSVAIDLSALAVGSAR